MSGQIRVGGMGGIIGFDLGVAFPMGAALGVPAYLIAEFLPDIERAAVAALNSRVAQEND